MSLAAADDLLQSPLEKPGAKSLRVAKGVGKAASRSMLNIGQSLGLGSTV